MTLKHVLCLTGLAGCFLACTSRLVPADAPTKALPPETIRVKLLDLFVVNDKFIIPDHPAFLQKQSKALGYDIELAGKKFTIGFIDKDGNGRFDDAGKDWVMAATFRTRVISINNRHGTHHIPVKEPFFFLKVDEQYFKIQLPDADKTTTITAVSAPPKAGEILSLVTKVPFERLTSLDDKPVDLGAYFSQGKLVFLFFWNLKPMPQTTDNDAQIRALDQISAHFSKKINLVGLRVVFSEPFGTTNPQYLKEMRESSWDNLICSEEFYEAMQQDLYFIKGVLAKPDGEIIDVNLSPKDLLAQLEAKVYE